MTRIKADWLHDADVQTLCRVFADAGHQIWFVGGCVRNALIGAPVSDLDLSTTARPDVSMQLAADAGLKAIPTGIDHGTVTVVVGDTPFEITTFRKDIATDGRRAVVTYADTMAEDALRRDFTMNALYADADGMIADPLGGLPDLHARRVRFIEDPDQRIKEDYLRILRFFRFHAWYGDADAGIDAEGLAACAANVDGIEKLSRERLRQEMLKLLAAPNPAPAVAAFAATGGLMRVVPGAVAEGLAVLVHVEEMAVLEPHSLRRLAMLGGADIAERLRLSKKETRALDVLQSVMSPAEVSFRHGAALGVDKLAIEAASLGQEIDPKQREFVVNAAGQTFPLIAADLMPEVKGAALGQALKEAEVRWIASGFVLTKEELLG